MPDIIINSQILLTILVFMLLVIGVCLFIIGYFIGQSRGAGVLNEADNRKPIGFFDKNNTVQKVKQHITIDDTKVVTEIDTKGLEKKYNKLGDIKESSENIGNSINKLKNMKG